MLAWVGGLLGWVRGVLSEDSCASFARCATAVTVATGCWSVIAVVRTQHQLPEAASLAALGVWMTAPYAINKATAAWGKAEAHHEDPPKP